ncbi:hypothetical protein T01_11893 [Trichinella spiralis]|uniref:Uncharacterized protein n=1 Tax=Trichinella spiralis TaxID=6334 RepID=A0A0V1B869_TRISP|nr:hypothetical protein T01_11893 [Trichinella spiralis]
MQIFSYQNCLGQRAPHQQRTKERELFTRMNDHRLPVSGVHFSVAPVALKFDWTVKLGGQPPLTLLPIMARGQLYCPSDSVEIAHYLQRSDCFVGSSRPAIGSAVFAFAHFIGIVETTQN